MRFLLITLPRDKNRIFIYPHGYDEEIAPHVCDHLYYSDAGRSMLLAALADGTGPVDLPSRVEEISADRAKAISDAFDHEEILVTGDGAVRRLQILASLGREVDDQDEAALDPDNPTPGFTRKSRFYERVSK